MLSRRLYLQIYLTVIGSLVILVVLSALTWTVVGRDRQNRDMFELVGALAYMTLPPADASVDEQAAAIDRLSQELRIDITLFDDRHRLVTASGPPARPPKWAGPRGRWRRAGAGEWALNLPDGRWLVADLRRRGPRRPLLGLLAFLGAVAVSVAAGAYPLVRRLTRRLERLQTGVEKIGAGDLSARVEVSGRDEVARLAASFNEAAGKIESLIDAHRMLLANASHELRTPLSRIRLGIELLKGDDPDRRAALEQDIAELDSLIDEILLMSRLDAGTHDRQGDKVDIVALAAEECAHYPGCELSGSAPEITGDARLLRRAIRNLLDNAYAHGAPPVRVTLSRDGDTVVLTVSDKGPGIARRHLDRVFQPFYRGPDRQNVDGHGLGLALVRQIAEVLGGSAAIRSSSEAGTVIDLTLPIRSDQR